MPFTVITLINTPKSLRGDLTKWMQEIATGVFVGNFNTKIREELWERVLENVGSGEATLSYTARNEIGYNFKTHNTRRQAVDFEGIPLIMLENRKIKPQEDSKLGFSQAAKFRKIKKYNGSLQNIGKNLIYIDIETDGLDVRENNIIEIGAVKIASKQIEFKRLIKIGRPLPLPIKNLTGIREEELEKGVFIKQALSEFLEFIGDQAIVGYNIKFDIRFLNHELERCGFEKISNKTYDLMEFVKKDNPFLTNYKLQTALEEYGIATKQVHRALEDAKLCYELSLKVNKFQRFIK